MLLVGCVHSHGIRVANEANTSWGDTCSFKQCSRILHHIALRIDALEIIVFSVLTNVMDSSCSFIPIAVEAVLLPLVIIIYHPGTFSCPNGASHCSLNTLGSSPEWWNPTHLSRPGSEVPSSLTFPRFPHIGLLAPSSSDILWYFLYHSTVALPTLNGS